MIDRANALSKSMPNLKSLRQYTRVALFILLLWSTACAIPPAESERTPAPEMTPELIPTNIQGAQTVGGAEEIGLDAYEMVERMVRSFDEVSSFSSHYDSQMGQERMIGDCVRAGDETFWCSILTISSDLDTRSQTDIFLFHDHSWIKPDGVEDSWVFADNEEIEMGYGGPNSLELFERVENVATDMRNDQPVYRIELEYNAQLLLEQLSKTGPDVDSPFQSNQETTAEGTILIDVETYRPLLEKIIVYSGSSSSEPAIQMEIRYDEYNELEELSFIPVAEELYRVANDFTVAMGRGDYEAARGYFSARAQEEVSISTLETFANSNPTLFDEYNISGASVESVDSLDDFGLQGPFQDLLLEMNMADGAEQFLRFVFEQEGDDWKLVRFDEMLAAPDSGL